MALSERYEYKVEIIPPYSHLQVRRAEIVERDGVEISRSYHRHALQPGSDVSAECAVVQSIAPVLWTEEVLTAYASRPQPIKIRVSSMPEPTEPDNRIPVSTEQAQ